MTRVHDWAAARNQDLASMRAQYQGSRPQNRADACHDDCGAAINQSLADSCHGDCVAAISQSLAAAGHRDRAALRGHDLAAAREDAL